MKLSVAERLALGNLLPQQGDFITLKITRKLREALSFSEEELGKLNFLYQLICPKCQQSIYSPGLIQCAACETAMKPSGSISWDNSKDPIKDVYMGKKAEEVCRQAIEKLSQSKKLETKHMSLYEKFVGDEGEE